MSINLDPHIKCSLPKNPKPMSPQAVIKNLKDLVADFGVSIDVFNPSKMRNFIYDILTHSDTDLRSAQRKIDDLLDGTEKNDEVITKFRLAKSVAYSGNVMFIQSSMIDQLIKCDLMDCMPGSLHLLHFLQVKSGWTLTAIGMEDSLFLRDEERVCIFNGTLTEDFGHMNYILREMYDGFDLRQEVPFKLNVINPLDIWSWREHSSLPYPLRDNEDEDDAMWTNRVPIDCSTVPLLSRVYDKLDDTASFKNDLVKELIKLRKEHEALKEYVRELRGPEEETLSN